jgi:AcrR family transcriptional regulator
MAVAFPAPLVLESTTREAILDAAERRFAERGFEGVSVREIAADAGLKNQASLYHHFEHKQAIYEAVLARAVELLVTVVEESARSGSLRASDAAARADGLSRYLDRVLDFLVAHPQLARLIQRVSMDDEEASRDIVARLARPLFTEGVRLLGEARDGWPADELPHLAAGLYHLIFGYFADAALLRSVMADDPMSKAAIMRQRRFVHTAVERLLGVDNTSGDTR